MLRLALDVTRRQLWDLQNKDINFARYFVLSIRVAFKNLKRLPQRWRESTRNVSAPSELSKRCKIL